MRRGRFAWKILFTLTGMLSLWFAVLFIKVFIQYIQVDSYTRAKIEKWEIEEASESKFFLKAHYTYAAQGRTYSRAHSFLSAPFPNEFTAGEALKEWEKKPWKAWYSKRSPKLATLQKIFPLRAFIHAVLSLGICLYFGALRSFLQRRYQSS